VGIPDDNGHLIVAANFGDESNPAWYHNIKAHPRVTIVTSATSRDYDVIELTGDKRAADSIVLCYLIRDGDASADRPDIGKSPFFD
jgi:deazaflavin-dependent oxidoreductase (nitroreductase family)